MTSIFLTLLTFLRSHRVELLSVEDIMAHMEELTDEFSFSFYFRIILPENASFVKLITHILIGPYFYLS